MRTLLASIALTLTFTAAAQEADQPATPGSVIAEATPEEWLAIPADDLLVMELAPDAAGNARTVIIQLMPPPFSQPWVENIRTLAAAHWWDGTSVNRVQDNYVTQWGDVTEEKVLPEGVVSPMADHQSTPDEVLNAVLSRMDERELARILEDPTSSVEYQVAQRIAAILGTGIYADRDGFIFGWPTGQSGGETVWPIHCYGYVGVGRNVAPDTGTGAELYTIIGQPQRHMDRNLAVVGRVIEGMEHLSSLPRGHGDLGFYTEEEAHLRTPILSVRLGSELVSASSSKAVGQQEAAPTFEYLDTTSESFARYVHVRANRNDAFYTVPAGGVDVCSVQVPVRRAGE